MQTHVGRVLYDPLLADLQLPEPLQEVAGLSPEFTFADRKIAPKSAVQDGGQRSQQIVDTAPDDDPVPVDVHPIPSYGDDVGPVGKRQTVDDLHRSGWNSPNS
jgi:hypothetical protein